MAPLIGPSTLTIALNGTVATGGNGVNGEIAVPPGMFFLTISCISSALTGTVNLKRATTTDGTYYIYQDGAVDVSISALRCFNKAVPEGFYKLVSTSAEGGARTFSFSIHAI